MHALEIASACRILLLRDALLIPDNNTLDLLMNVPPLADITPLTETLHRLIKQKDTDQAIHVPQSAKTMVPRTPTSPAGPAASNIQDYHHLQPQFQQQPPIPSPASMGQFHHPLEPQQGDSTKFSFSKMRQSLGQKGESLRQKIITTTNEWKEAAAKREGSASFSVPSASSSHSFDPLGGLVTHTIPDGNQPSRDGQFADPLLHNASATAVANPRQQVAQSLTPTQPKTPKQYQHEMWSQLLQQKIFTVQEFLIALESKENKGTVPGEVWEALADMDRMQRELLNYSRNMAGTQY